MKYFLLIVALVFISATCQANQNPWKLMKQANGIMIFQRPAALGYPITRGSMEIDSSPDALISLMRDNSACQRWLHLCKQSRIIKRYNAESRLDYTVIDSPFLFADRDLYTFTELTFNRASQTALIRISGREGHDKGQAGRVRIKSLQGFWRMKKLSPNRTSMLYQVYSNPQLMPSQFLNKHLVESVFYTLKNLATVSKEEKYRNARLEELK